MHTAGWLDVWHLVIGIVARQEPFVAIMLATLAVFVVVMAIEGVRTSLLSIWRAHRAAPEAVTLAPPPEAPIALAAPALEPLAKNNSSTFSARLAAAPARRPKPLTLSPRQFRSPRPKIRRHARLDFSAFTLVPENTAAAPLELRDAI
jgi:hypothetical protein